MKFFSFFDRKHALVFFAFMYMSCSVQQASRRYYYNTSQTCTQSSTVNVAVTTNPNPLTIGTGDVNAVPIAVGCGYANEPCVSVTICAPGSNGSNYCQTIPNMLLDTGSYGVRIFDNAQTSLNTTVNIDSYHVTPTTNLYECVSYVDGFYQWGQVVTADVTLKGLTAQAVPIQIIESNPSNPSNGRYGVPSACINQQGTAGTSDQAALNYNGIIGVGLKSNDCQNFIFKVNSNLRYMYFLCTSGSGCVDSPTPVSEQVTNPVALMPTGYNNGVAIQLSNVPDSGTGYGLGGTGYMVMGIGSTSANANGRPGSAVKVFLADQYDCFRTQYGGQTYSSSFIDSGSNGLFFPNGCLEIDSDSGFYAPGPGSEVGFTATQLSPVGYGSTTATINFNVFDAATTSNAVFNNLAGDTGSNYFDWGLPFFLGRTVYVGITGSSATLHGTAATGPFWAY